MCCSLNKKSSTRVMLNVAFEGHANNTPCVLSVQVTRIYTDLIGQVNVDIGAGDFSHAPLISN